MAMIFSEFSRKVDVDAEIFMTQLKTLFAAGDKNAHTFKLMLCRKGAPLDIDGADVIGYFIRSDGPTVQLSGEVDENVVTLTLDESCYAVIGQFSLIIKVTIDDERKAVFWGNGYITRSKTDKIIDPGNVVPSLEELLAQIAAVEAAAKDARAAASTATAAASKIDTMTVTATGLDAGSAPTAELTEVDGRYSLALGVPKGAKGDTGDIGPQGPQGEPGKDAPQEAVLYTAQELDDAQKALARANIGAADAESVSQLKEDIGDLENLKYRELYGNLFYDFFGNVTNKSGNMTENGNAQHIFIQNAYSNGIKLESGNYLVAFKLTNISFKKAVNKDSTFAVCIIDGWSKKYLGDLQYYNGEKELFVYSVINFTNDNDIKVSPCLIFNGGFEPNSEYSFDVDTIAIIKSNTNGLTESILCYGNQKMYPVFDMHINLSNFKNAYILNKKLVANDTSGESDVSAQYTVARMENTVNKIMLKGIFDTNTTIAIITEPNGMTNVTDVTNRSIHVTFGANGCSVGYFDNKALTNIRNISWDGDYIGKEVTIGFEISGNTITVYLPNGNTLTETNEKLVSCGGKYALWEHYIGGLSKRLFHSAQFTKIYAKDIDGNVLCDDFNREDGSIGNSPQGYIYGQFTNENQTGWVF